MFKNSRIVSVTHYPEAAPRAAGMVMTVEFELDGQRFVAINGGPQYWERLSEGGSEGPCGWLKDSYGLSWQVVPTWDGGDFNSEFDDVTPGPRKLAERVRAAAPGHR